MKYFGRTAIMAIAAVALVFSATADAATITTTTTAADGGSDFFAFDSGSIQINGGSGSGVVGSLPNNTTGVRSFYQFSYDVSSTIGSGETLDDAFFSVYFRNPDGGPFGPVSLLYRTSAPADNDDLYGLGGYTDTGIDLDVTTNNQLLTTDITAAFADELATGNDGTFLVMLRADDEALFSTTNQQAYFFATSEFTPSAGQTAGGYSVPTLTINSSAAAIPEPTMLGLLPLAIGVVAGKRRWRSRQVTA